MKQRKGKQNQCGSTLRPFSEICNTRIIQSNAETTKVLANRWDSTIGSSQNTLTRVYRHLNYKIDIHEYFGNALPVFLIPSHTTTSIRHLDHTTTCIRKR